MKIVVLQENLKKVLGQLRRVVPSKPQLPVLSSFLVEATEHGIVVSATDLYTGMRVNLAGDVEVVGKAAVPAVVFSDLVNTLSPGKVELELNDGTLSIKSSQSTATIQCYVSDDFPDFPEKEGEQLEVSWEAFEQILKCVPFATAKDDARPVLTSILFSLTPEGSVVVGTDGFRLSHLSLDSAALQAPQQSDDSTHLLLPAKALQEVYRVAAQQRKDSAQPVLWTFSKTMRQIFFGVDETEMVIRLMDGEFPPYQKIMPSEFATEIELDAEELESRLKGALVFARDSSFIVTLEPEGGSIMLSAVSPSLGSQRSQLTASVLKGSLQPISFNAHYILELLQTVKPEKITLCMNESLQPTQFKIEALPQLTYIVMPFRTTQTS